eukprot:scaffold2006_cov283-Chaetoceros_neogracile.AAC.14
MDSSSIPVMRSPNDIMTYGPNGDNLAAAAIQSHPQSNFKLESSHITPSLILPFTSSPSPTATTPTTSPDLDSIRRLYGSALAMRLTTERVHAANVGGRLPGLDAHPNSNIMLETLTGDDVTIDFGDYLNISTERAVDSMKGKSGVHDAMEARLGL